jgi:hypothetical protein
MPGRWDETAGLIEPGDPCKTPVQLFHSACDV